MRYFKKLKGDNIYLSPINVEDYEVYTKWMNDISTTLPVGNVSRVYSLSKEKESLEFLSKEGYNFAIILNEGNQLLGNCSLCNVNHLHRTADLGIFIGEEEYRGKGYGPEAIKIVLSYGFKILNLNNIMLKVFSFNERGIKSYIKVGFREIGRRRESYFVNGKYYDEVYMEILSKDFKSTYLDNELPK